MSELTKEELTDRWQQHRIRCLRFAIKAGAPVNELTQIAEIIGNYILARSKDEVNALAALSKDAEK